MEPPPPPVNYPDSDSDNTAFFKAMNSIRGRDVVEYLACGMYPLSASVNFAEVADGTTPVSRVKLPLLKLRAICSDDEDDVQFLAGVKLEAEGVAGGYTCPKHDAYVMSMQNRGRLNHVFELAGVTYGPQPEPGIEAHTEASRKR
jgi:hypothetical protein